MIPYEEMTLSEIEDAHPKCAHPDGKPWCKHYGWIYTSDSDPAIPEENVCDIDMLVIEDPSKDYCMMHSALAKNQTEEKK
jgi:hypothetical protein